MDNMPVPTFFTPGNVQLILWRQVGRRVKHSRVSYHMSLMSVCLTCLLPKAWYSHPSSYTDCLPPATCTTTPFLSIIFYVIHILKNNHLHTHKPIHTCRKMSVKIVTPNIFCAQHPQWQRLDVCQRALTRWPVTLYAATYFCSLTSLSLPIAVSPVCIVDEKTTCWG